MKQPVIDLHCDLLCYLQDAPAPDLFKKDEIGCSFPALEEGNVKLQVMAIYTGTEPGSSMKGIQQSAMFKDLLTTYNSRLTLVSGVDSVSTICASSNLGMIAAVENASGFCEEGEPLAGGFKKLERIISNTGRLLYIGMTHHGENRFGGGNSTRMGLKDDGRALLDYMSGRQIAIDLSHTSDALAFDILSHISKAGLDVPVIASHSNYRKIWDHPRNLPDEMAQEIIKRKGLIGINFLRAFLNNDDPNAIYDHIMYGIGLGGAEAICFGADYFYTPHHPDQSRKPFFFPEHDNASRYPAILQGLAGRIPQDLIENVSHKNVIDFIQRVWA